MKPGQLRHRITIQRPSELQDATGQAVQTWEDFAEVWAAIEPLRGSELFTAQTTRSEVVTRIRVRYLAGVGPKMRVFFGDRIYQVETVINTTERNFELVLMCSEVIS